MFSGLDKTKASTVATNLVYLFYSGVAGKIYNNTFYMPKLTDATGTGYYACIQLSGNTAEIKNNIFISDVDVHANPYFISAVPTPVSDNNIFHMRHSLATHKVVSTYTSLADYVSANPTKDTNSKNVNVIFADQTIGDLRISGASVQDNYLSVPRLDAVTEDMFGTSRASITYAGAHESTLPFIISDVQQPALKHTIARTDEGVLIELGKRADVEIYNVSGKLIEKVNTEGTYTRELNNGIYIIRIDGVSTKFIK